MSVDFSKFDSMVNQEQLAKQMEAAPENDEVPAGEYIVSVETMEIKPTKAGDKLMFAVGCKIKETLNAPKCQNGRWVFFNRVICGNKTSEKWNDGRAIKGVITWLEELTGEEGIEFKNYSQFSDEVTSLYQDICPAIEVSIKYDPEAFNPIEIVEVFDVEC